MKILAVTYRRYCSMENGWSTLPVKIANHYRKSTVTPPRSKQKVATHSTSQEITARSAPPLPVEQIGLLQAA